MTLIAVIVAVIGGACLGGYFVNNRKKNKNSKGKNKANKVLKKTTKKAVESIAKIPAAIVKHGNDMFNEAHSVISDNLYSNTPNQQNTRNR